MYDPVAYLSGADTQVTTSTVRSARRVSREPIRRTYELFEHERWVVLAGWSAKVSRVLLVFCFASPTRALAQHLFPTDPQQYTDVKGVPRAKEVQLSPHWSWTGEWRVEVTEHTDANGYAYAFNWGDETVWSSKMGAKDFVRRRKAKISRGDCFPPLTLVVCSGCVRFSTTRHQRSWIWAQC